MMRPQSNVSVKAIRQTTDIAGTRMVRTGYEPALKLSEHSHRHANITVVLAGELTEWSEGRAYRRGAGSVVIKPAGTTHANLVGPDGAVTLAVELRRGRNQVWRDRPRKYGWTQGPDIIGMIISLWKAAAQHDLADSIPDITRLLAQAYEATSVHPDSPRAIPDWLSMVHTIIEKNYDDALQVQSLAEQVGVHRVHLSRTFRRVHGIGIVEYIHRRRVMRIATLLARAELPLADVALTLGYADQAHMTRVFTARIGMSPAAYRRLLL